MNKKHQKFLNRLVSGSVFRGRNGAFTGRMYPLEVDVDNDTMVVQCENENGSTWDETWDDLKYVLYAFERGDYYFEDNEETLLTKDNFEVTINIVDDCCENEGGFYVEVEINDQKVDDFCIHPEDCDCEDPIAVMEYARDYVRKLELDWDGSYM